MTITRLSAALITTAVLAGCGGSEDEGTDPAAFSAAFAKATGVKLVERDSGDLTVLRPREDGNYERFGVFSIYLFDDDEQRERIATSGELKEYDGDIGVSSPTSDRDPEVARRLDQAVRAAIADDPSLIPASERACTTAGIDPARGKEGTCRLPDKQLTVVNAATALRTKALTAQLEGVTTLDALPRRYRYIEPQRAQGRYVIVRMTVSNATTAPLTALRSTLVIGPNTYSETSDAYQLEDRDRRPFPLQPGATTTVTKAYDIPPEAAVRAQDQGAIELPAGIEDGGYLSDRAAVGRIRLADAKALTLRGSTAPSTSGSGSGSGSSGSSPSRGSDVSAKRAARTRSAEGALKEFYSALRKGNVRYVCRRLTRAVQNRFGGPTACRQGRFIKAEAKSKAPSTNSGLRLTTVLTSNQTRALILVRGKNGFSDAAKLARQDGLWRVQGTRKLTGG